MWSTLPREKKHRQDYLAHYCVWKTSSNKDSITFPRRLFQGMTALTTRKKKKNSRIKMKLHPVQHVPTLSLVFSMWIECFSPFRSCPLSWREIIAISTLLRRVLSLEILSPFLKIKRNHMGEKIPEMPRTKSSTGINLG